ncbi:amino acid permease [Saccharothrix australiensis]|uniref:L-asparagine transporter-like permease n=1 Tax=Saccharothrix australiensis TaxID=2072 RepID=A0A495W3Z1_9PSEU|nr:amino acid permease [Saccharothrix australiensis]RKT56084.1 L-asparagine transporter-like permease [Saccharothrix australiensis]
MAVPPPTTDTRGLRRALTGPQLSMIGLGGAIGTGLFLGSALAISHAGPAIVVAYALCALVAFVIAWALTEMVVVHPEAGSFGAVAHRYLGPLAGFVQRWTYWTIQAIAVGGEIVAAGLYVRFWWPDLPLWPLVAAFSAVVLTANALAVRFFGAVEYWFAMVKVVAVAVFIALGLLLIAVGLPESPATGLSHLTAHGGFLPNGVSGLFLAMVFVLFSYLGTEVVAVTAAESENPGRDLPRAARRMVLRLVLFYVLAIAVIVTVAPWTVTAQGGSVDASPFVRVVAGAGVPAAATIINFVVLTAALSSANTNLYLSTRMLHSLAADGYAPAWTARVSRTGVPRNALALSALGPALAVALSATSGSAYLALFGVSVFGALLVWMLILATHWAFRRAATHRSPVRLWGAPVTSGLAALFLLAVLVSTAFIDGLDTAWRVGLPFFAALVVVHTVITRRRSRSTP